MSICRNFRVVERADKVCDKLPLIYDGSIWIQEASLGGVFGEGLLSERENWVPNVKSPVRAVNFIVQEELGDADIPAGG